MPRVLFTLASIALAVYALADCVSTEDDRVKGLPKLLWVLVIVFVPWIGPITWILVGKDRSQPQPTGLAKEFQDRFAPPTSNGTRGRRGVTRPLAPDEDPEFLARLDREIREERRRRLQDPLEVEKDAEGPEAGRPEAESAEAGSP
ncbi:MAG: PLD nuclease N-terminal domain-containing protein, partial [Dermabacter sp.]|nr:PLD nuclease N-terminal domain-containing protein [Dermabacter sp.]